MSFNRVNHTNSVDFEYISIEYTMEKQWLEKQYAIFYCFLYCLKKNSIATQPGGDRVI